MDAENLGTNLESLVKNVFIINGHQPYAFAKGRLNGSLVAIAQQHLLRAGYEVALTQVSDGWDVENEIARHQWADVVLMQFPVNWMGAPWSFKKYVDEVYTAGMDGRLCHGDGRHGPDEAHRYGLGGSLEGKHYLLSVTLNAPRESFDNDAAPFFEGRSVDDLLWPTHLNAKFFGLRPLPTFAAHDVMKNPEIEADFARFRGHLEAVFPKRVAAAGEHR